MKTVGINLIPTAIQYAQSSRRLLRRWVTVVAAAALCALGAFGLDIARSAEISTLHDQVARAQKELDGLRAEVRNYSAESTLIEQQLSRADALRSKRAWSGLLALVIARVPQDCSLISIATDPARPTPENPAAKPNSAANTPQLPANAKGVAPAVPPPPPKTVLLEAPRKIRVMGHSGDPAQPVAFVSALQETGVFAQVRLERAEWDPSSNQQTFRFELVCEW